MVFCCCFGLGIGLLLVAVGLIALIVNENVMIPRYVALQEARRDVVTVSSSTTNSSSGGGVDAATSLEGLIIHTTGLATTNDTLRDKDFDVVAPEHAVRFRRTVLMYQWNEDSLDDYGSSTSSFQVGNYSHQTDTTARQSTSYNYRVGWYDHLINSQDFHMKDGHENPNRMEYTSYDMLAASGTHVGSRFQLKPFMIQQIGPFQPLGLSPGLYLGKGDELNPQIGDTKVSFEYVGSTVVTLAGQAQQTRQSGSIRYYTIVPYTTRIGRDVWLLEPGKELSAQELFATAMHRAGKKAWGWRCFGFLCIFAGVWLIHKPLALFGSLIGLESKLVSLHTTLVLCLVVPGLVWWSYNFIVAVLLLASAGGVTFNLWRTWSKGISDAKEAANVLLMQRDEALQQPEKQQSIFVRISSMVQEADTILGGRLIALTVTLFALLMAWLLGSALVGLAIQGAYVVFVCIQKGRLQKAIAVTKAVRAIAVTKAVRAVLSEDSERTVDTVNSAEDDIPDGVELARLI